MKIISITGTASGVGKTTIAQFLLRHFFDLSALKITTKHEGNCTRQSDCDVCDTMAYPYKITVDPLQINQPGKDTALFKSAGARKVVWLQTHSECLRMGIEEALSYFDKGNLVLVEGNSFLHTHNASLSILVTTAREPKIKRSTKQIISKIDLAVINKYKDDTSIDIMKTQERLYRIGCHVPVFIINPFLENYTPNEVFLNHIREIVGQPIQSL
ncbi:hypothetical protein [Candidatus Jettenia sp. AMX1]|nr:hypothetical protein [Candidatus Jettenia sp. AMX1]MDL1939145.1 molybdopterin-guanine dinucleotide biosynthesis protein MobB [Candidatus Jettenia sp. AMX1]WKZ15549.1 MAG: hypothetical protein QY317_16775 [Candidatus Jettenia caeni]